MTLQELNTLLEATGLPVAYSHFKATDNNPVPDPPFITYLVSGSDNLMADNKVYKKISNVEVELYTKKKNLEVEQKLEDLFDENGIPYETYETWIESQRVFQKIYEIGVI
ncbi:hypothetical protein [Halalkalibacter sp. APA_J-10(15)]|uniref:hypothetical protein n=1 Tax=Halalkalibacter sp. APA_J-10(15) TaxID=2933805 RepID=UPI001FF4C7B0|nr:hypothetical protein [Halalkalibacter sp. APA_J-10(15)]MCK0471394.1 hypothetical protein [Halalkalibacter sp. APA_J-10(15)]